MFLCMERKLFSLLIKGRVMMSGSGTYAPILYIVLLALRPTSVLQRDNFQPTLDYKTLFFIVKNQHTFSTGNCKIYIT